MSLLDEAQPLTEAAKIATKSWFFYGPAGSGKSTFAVKHPGKKKLWIDVDDKMGELENISVEERSRITVWSPKVTLGNKDIQIVQVDSTRKDPYIGTKILTEPMGFRKVVSFMNELLALGYKTQRGEVQFPYDVVVLDTITRLMDHLEYLVMYQHKVSNLTETLYGVIKRNIKEALQGFLNLPCERIIIGHSKLVEKRDREGNIKFSYIRPHITGTISEEIVGWFSEAYYFMGRQPGDKWTIQTMTDKELPARTTKGLEFEQVLDPKRIYGS